MRASLGSKYDFVIAARAEDGLLLFLIAKQRLHLFLGWLLRCARVIRVIAAIRAGGESAGDFFSAFLALGLRFGLRRNISAGGLRRVGFLRFRLLFLLRFDFGELDWIAWVATAVRASA